MIAKFHSHSIYAGQSYYRVTDDHGNPLTMVLVSNDLTKTACVTFEILAEAYPSERKSILAAVIAAMP